MWVLSTLETSSREAIWETRLTSDIGQCPIQYWRKIKINNLLIYLIKVAMFKNDYQWIFKIIYIKDVSVKMAKVDLVQMKLYFLRF